MDNGRSCHFDFGIARLRLGRSVSQSASQSVSRLFIHSVSQSVEVKLLSRSESNTKFLRESAKSIDQCVRYRSVQVSVQLGNVGCSTSRHVVERCHSGGGARRR